MLNESKRKVVKKCGSPLTYVCGPSWKEGRMQKGICKDKSSCQPKVQAFHKLLVKEAGLKE